MYICIYICIYVCIYIYIYAYIYVDWPFGCHCSLAFPRVTFQTLFFGSNAWPLGPATFFREVRTIDLWSHKWWEMFPDTHLQKSRGPIGREKWSQQLSKCRYLSTDLSTLSIDHGRYRRSIRIHLFENTVDIDGRCRFTYGELRWIVDGRLKFEIILWSISSTTLVIYICMYIYVYIRIYIYIYLYIYV